VCRRELLTLVALATLVACDCEGEPAAPVTTTSEPAPGSAPEEALATAEPPPGEDDPLHQRRHPSELSPEERGRLVAAVPHVREGQRLARGGDHAAALSAFERALERAPDHPGALCEAGWQAFRLDDLDRAKDLLHRGARLSRMPNRRAACLYNLGRVYEARNEPAEAKSRYEESLRLRPNDIVADRLAALATGLGSADKEPEVYPSIEAFCEDVVDEMNERVACEVTDTRPFPDAGASAELVFLDDAYMTYDWTYHHVLLRTDAGLVALALLGESECHGFDTVGQDTTVEDVSIEQVVPGGKNEVVMRVVSAWWDDSAESGAMWQCEDAGFEFDSDECTEIMDASGGSESGAIRNTFVCAEVGDQWCCHGFGEEIPSPAEVMTRVCEA
jgi:hypothetical protein